MKYLFVGNKLSLVSGHSRPLYLLCKEILSSGDCVSIITTRSLGVEAHQNEIRLQSFLKSLSKSQRRRFSIDTKIIKSIDQLITNIDVRRKLNGKISDSDVIICADLTTYIILRRLLGYSSERKCVGICSSIPVISWNDILKVGLRGFITVITTPHLLISLLMPRPLFRELIGKNPRIIFTSKYLIDYFESSLGGDSSKSTVIYPLIENIFPVNKEKITILYFGWASKIRGTGIALKVMNRLHEKYGQHISYIAALYDIDSLEHSYFINLLKGKKFIHRLNFVNDVSDILNNKTICLLPFRSPFAYAQPPLVLLEALKAGCSIITTNMGASKEFIKNGINGFVMEKPNVENFFAAADRLVSDKRLMNRVSTAAIRELNINETQKSFTVFKRYIESIEPDGPIEWNKYGSKEIYSRKDVAYGYDNKRFTTKAGLVFDSREKEQLFNAVRDYKPNAKILEVGCGTGRFSIFLSNNGYRKIVATDTSKNMIKITNAKLKGSKILMNRVEAKEADIYHLPFRNDSFDFVFSIRVLNQFFDNKNKFLAISELIRVTKPGGKIFFDIVNGKSLAIFAQKGGLMKIEELKDFLSANKLAKVELVSGNLILSQTLLEKSSIFVGMVSLLDKVLCNIFPGFATRVYIRLRKNQ